MPTLVFYYMCILIIYYGEMLYVIYILETANLLWSLEGRR